MSFSRKLFRNWKNSKKCRFGSRKQIFGWLSVISRASFYIFKHKKFFINVQRSHCGTYNFLRIAENQSFKVTGEEQLAPAFRSHGPNTRYTSDYRYTQYIEYIYRNVYINHATFIRNVLCKDSVNTFEH